jgi:hypothetical protein
MVALSCTAIIAALYVVGMVSGTELRHVVQTAPVWIAVVLGFRTHSLARWLALPIFIFWLAIMILIWLFLLGWARVLTGHFTPTEVAMTIVIGLASAAGIIAALRPRPAAGALPATAAFVLGAVLQFAAFRISMLPGISHR